MVGRSTAHLDDRDLLVQARDSPEAFAAFYRRHVDAVLAYYRRRGADAQQALDLTAETFAAALDGIESYEPRAAPGVAWLYGIARRVLAESHRRGAITDRARRRLAVDRMLVDDEGLARVEMRIASTQSDLLDAVRSLPAPERDAVIARVVDEREYEHIAADLCCSPQVARKRVSRGLARLRAALAAQQQP